MRFIKYFILEWNEYPMFKAFWDSRPNQAEELIEKFGEDESYLRKSRFQYAWDLAKIRWKHRDRYSRKCTGDCEHCHLKYC